MWANKNNGFTIVETLIFLAVSSVLFVSTSVLISGQIERYRTQDAAVQLEVLGRDFVNDVTTGYYPEIGDNISCTDTTTGVNRGTNTGCVLAGKRITFNQTTNTVVATPVVTGVLTASLTNTGQLTPLTRLNETKNYPSNITNLTGARTFYVLNTVFNPVIDANSDFVGGGQNVRVYAVNGVNLVPTTSANGKICFSNGKNRSSLTIGEAGGLTAKSQLKDTSC